jgi:hypothetical protein
VLDKDHGDTRRTRLARYGVDAGYCSSAIVRGSITFAEALLNIDHENGLLQFVASTEGLGHAFERCDRVNLHRARMCFGLDGVPFWRQLCAVPADDTALPRGARFFANAISQPEGHGKRRADPVIV